MEVKRKINPESIDKQSDDSCWEGYKKAGMKIKNQKKYQLYSRQEKISKIKTDIG